MATINDLILARNLTARVNEACAGLENGEAPILGMVSEMTGELLRWWFQQDYVDARTCNFHPGQRQAILNAIYAHETLGVKSLPELYRELAPDVILQSARAADKIGVDKNLFPKYCFKMATGTGKTWVLQAILVWQLLNANRAQDSARFTRNFLLVAPGLIVYDRLRDAFEGKEIGGKRDFATSDLHRFRELFIPDQYRDEVFRFVQGAVCPKEEIGRKVTSGGLIAISNWHVLSEEGEEDEEADIEAPGDNLDPAAIVKSLLPLTPGISQGNDLSVLNQRYERGGILNYLRDLPSLMVFNDEAHHIHEFKKEGEVSEVEWQKSLSAIAATKGERFIQMDFSATPYNELGGAGRKKKDGSYSEPKKNFFPHIIVDFDLKTAMRQGLVKSLVLDKRKEIGAIPNEDLEFKAYRDDNNNPQLAEGQRIMLRAGLTKLKKLERDFAKLDPERHPKMLVVCEDTTVTPLVEDFLKLEGVAEDDVLRVDSSRKGELKADEWKVLRERLFDVDRRIAPRVIISVLMLREGFDVNNICVIVPLRSSRAQILLEQTIGRGLRLMWRGNEYDDIKKDNRTLIRAGKTPESLIDVLSIVEHPAFQQFYEELIREGLASEEESDDTEGTTTGDLVAVDLVADYEQYDFKIPFILREREEELKTREIDVNEIPAFEGFSFELLKRQIGKNDKFISEDVQAKTRFGDYEVRGGVMTASGYNDYLGRLVRRLTEALAQPLTGSAAKYANQTQYPHLQINRALLAEKIDDYIRTWLFGFPVDPLEDENWRVLLLDMIVAHILKVWAHRLLEAEEMSEAQAAEVAHRSLSEVARLTMRESSSLLVDKCIYSRLPYPSRSGGLERAFIERCDRDASVDAFCKINEQKHSFAQLRYLKDDGLPAFYSPDFFVRCGTDIYMVETKAQGQVNTPNVKRKKRAAVSWCDRVNELLPADRSSAEWWYVLLGEERFYDWRDKGATIKELLEYARLRPTDERVQTQFAF